MYYSIPSHANRLQIKDINTENLSSGDVTPVPKQTSTYNIKSFIQQIFKQERG